MQLSDARDVVFEPAPINGTKSKLVRCKLKRSPRCQIWHQNKKKGCVACLAYYQTKFALAEIKEALAKLAGRETPLRKLSEKQHQVLCCYCAGKPIKEIGFVLQMNAHTVEYHMAEIKRKLGIFNPTLLVHYAFHKGYIDNCFNPEPAVAA